jgi:tetratricopeptide (TPR) repeat protein
MIYAHWLLCVAGLLALAGCGPDPNFRELRLAGQRQMIAGNYGAARGLFRQAHELTPEDAANLHDLADCCMYFAKQRFSERNVAAAMREVDGAIAYYQRSINAHPGFQASLVGKNLALELKGQFEEAVRVAEWAAKFVGPAARQQVFLAHEMEERGDLDAALLRYRQAVAMEPESATAQAELGSYYQRIGEEDLAIERLKRAYQLDPSQPGVRAALVELGVAPPEAPAAHQGQRQP